MAHGLSLHIGINQPDPAHYGGGLSLKWCVNDAEAMYELAKRNGFAAHLLTNQDATIANVEAVANKIFNLNAGDTFLLTFSGHGARCPDYNGDSGRSDGFDAAWALYDRLMVDDEVTRYRLRIPDNIYIVVVTDCCYSGILFEKKTHSYPGVLSKGGLVRSLGPIRTKEIIEKHPSVYGEVVSSLPRKIDADSGAAYLQMAACRYKEIAKEFDHYRHGVFTYTLLEVIKKGGFDDYNGFYKRICNQIPVSGQKPCMLYGGYEYNMLLSRMPFTL